MSFINEQVTNEQVIPSFESEVFDEHQASQFAVGIIAVGDQVMPGMNEALHQYLKLRANVYLDQTNMISPEHVQDDGTETDEDDARSIHVAVFENRDALTRVVGAMRLIIKSEEDDRPLPLETFFDETFQGHPAPLNSAEVSRYICRHEDHVVQNGLKWLLYTKTLGYIMANDLGPTYGVVEEPVESELKTTGVPIERVAEPKFVEEYAAENLAIEIDTDSLATLMGINTPSARAKLRATERQFDYSGAVVAATEDVVA